MVNALNKRFLLPLSATPVQNSLVELYNLLTHLKPGIFKTENEKKMVFVHHRETLHRLADLVEREGVACEQFEGGMTGPEKDAAVRRFQDEVTLLICTESGGEGRNLQFCNTLINFDLPWNPMTIEQRRMEGMPPSLSIEFSISGRREYTLSFSWEEVQQWEWSRSSSVFIDEEDP